MLHRRNLLLWLLAEDSPSSCRDGSGWGSAVGDHVVGVTEGTCAHSPYQEVPSDMGEDEGFVSAVLGLSCCVQARRATGYAIPVQFVPTWSGGKFPMESDGQMTK